MQALKNMEPSDYLIPHSEFRPHQGETLLKVLDAKPGDVTLLSAPTGSGKSAIPTGVSSQRKVIACTHTKLLQKQYRDIYEFDMMTGKGNHRCVHPDYEVWGLSAEDCPLPKMSMCTRSGECPYLVQKIRAMNSRRAVANYALWLTIGEHWVDKAPPDDLFLDEGHTLPEVVLGFVGTIITAERARNNDLPSLPDIPWTLPDKVRRLFATEWLDEARESLASTIKFYKSMKSSGKKWRDLYKRADRLSRKLGNTQYALENTSEDWYISSDEERFSVKPLTAKHHFPFYFLGDHRTHIQSATIGNPEVLAEELGVDKYTYIDVPNQFTPEQRPVYLLDVPRMGAASVRKNPKSLEQQADAVANLIKSHDPSWHWLLHAQSKRKINELLGRLGKRGLGDRTWEVPRAGTDQQLQAWEWRKKIPGTIIGSWSWSEGVDLGEVHGTIACDIPFGFLGSEYIRARMKAYPQMYRQMAAWETEQRCGRIRRGVEAHYNTNGVERKVVAIADQNINMIMNYLSDGFKESLVEV